MSSINQFDYQDKLKWLHEEDKIPLTDDKGRVFCAYSLEKKLPPCPFNHRGPEVDIEINGVKQKVFSCCDVRMRDSLKPIK